MKRGQIFQRWRHVTSISQLLRTKFGSECYRFIQHYFAHCRAVNCQCRGNCFNHFLMLSTALVRYTKGFTYASIIWKCNSTLGAAAHFHAAKKVAMSLED